MSRVRQRGTAPERVVQALLRRMHLRYRSHPRNLPGTPDLILRDFGVAIFVHGCFWHNHRACRRGALPASNRNFWVPKIAGNVRRDRLTARQLRAAGWRVAIIWECQARNEHRLTSRIRRITSHSD